MRATADARIALREAAATAAEAASRARIVAQLLDEALAGLQDGEPGPGLVSLVAAFPGGARCPQPAGAGGAGAGGRGRTNKAIADALYVSPNTVKTHVSSLLHKLRADTRVQLAAIATRQGLQ